MSASMLGDILFVDLTNRKISKRPYTKELASQYIGCRGYNAALLWEMVPKGADPLGPENVLIFGAGPSDRHCGSKLGADLGDHQKSFNQPLP